MPRSPLSFPHFDAEAIEAALFNQLLTAIGPLPDPYDPGAAKYPFVTTTRNPSTPENSNSANQPLLGLVGLGASEVEVGAQGLEKWLLHYRVLVYIRADATPDTIPSTQLNYAWNAIVLAMRSGPTYVQQKLGGLVDDCYISGDILRDNGNLDQQCVLMVPIIAEVGI